MYDIVKIGYMPGYGIDSPHKFTRTFPVKVSVSVDNINPDPAADFKVLLQSEPPNLYIKFYSMVQENQDKFDLILSYDNRILEFSNAKEFCAVGSWIGNDIKLDKQNEISFMMSTKINGDAYHMRFQIMRSPALRAAIISSIGAMANMPVSGQAPMQDCSARVAGLPSPMKNIPRHGSLLLKVVVMGSLKMKFCRRWIKPMNVFSWACV